MYKIYLTKKAEKQKDLLKQAKLDKKVRLLLDLISKNPYQNPPVYEKLIGDFDGTYSRRINRQHRLVYAVDDERKEIKILSLWTHYE